MDHWGDPWTDADDKSPTKQGIASPPPTIARAPVVLNGFLDDAQWGSNEDDGFGAWASSPRKSELEPETGVNGNAEKSISAWGELPDTPRDGSESRGRGEMLPESNEWNRVEEDAEEPKESDNVVSETSDSATTIQPDDAHGRIATDFADSLHPDDDLSTRPSTSPSDISHNEVATESPRTSFEEERAAAKQPPAELEPVHHIEEEKEEGKKAIEETETQPKSARSQEADDGFGDFEDDVVQETAESQLKAESVEQPLPLPGWGAVQREPSHVRDGGSVSSPIATAHVGTYSVDTELIAQLFPSPKDVQPPDEAPDDPVHSTPTRKAWYRLTRNQTMREFNSGNDDDNYIRVTWKTSYIQSEVNKIVARWATEDRRGAGARASFYLDTQAPPDQKTPFHPRKKSTISVSNPIRPVKQNVQLLSTDAPAAFSWSSPSTAHVPSKQEAGGMRSTSSPVVVKHSAISKLQRHERPVSVELTPGPKQPAFHKRTATTTDFFNEATPAPSFSPIEPPERPVSDNTGPWASLGALDTILRKQEITTGDGADDDDWGEMVESPAVSTVQTPVAEFPEPSTCNNTLSTPATTPKSVKKSPLQPLPGPIGSKHASPIVRLKGTVSPTSALFKSNAFVPAAVEEGPIGPGMLKARDRPAESTPEKKRSQPESIANLDEVLETDLPNATVEEEHVDNPALETSEPAHPTTNTDDDFSAFEDPVPQPRSLSPPKQSDDLDFSIFESSVPTSAPPKSQPQPDPSDPWSIFETPVPPSAEPFEPTTPFTRPPPRAVTPPPKQPLTGATNSAQKRKVEEDDIIRSIVEGLPDLSYMLRR